MRFEFNGSGSDEGNGYKPYQPTPWERRIDQAFGLISTRKALNRMVDREKMNWFRYMAAQSSSARRNSQPTSAGEWLKIQREKMQVMWNAIDMVDNSGLCSGIMLKFPTYICGTLRWQAKTGDKNVNKQYQQYIQQKTGKPGNIDISGRHSLRQMCMLDVKSIMLKGDVGTNIVREDDEIYLQGIEGNRIGDPYRWVTSDTYVRGLNLDPDTGKIMSVRIYHQDRRSGMYLYDDTFPMRDDRGLPKFLFFTNPIDFDNYRGVSVFKHAIDNDTYITSMRQYELQALLWAASQSGVYYTKSGTIPEQLPFSANPVTDRDGNVINTYSVRPNTITALSAEGEDVKMFQHDRPSPNVIGMYENTVLDICNGVGITKQFGYDMAGVTGPAVRMASAQDARAISIWQEMLREQKLDPVIMLLLGDAIAKGDLPYHKNWLQWDWFFPAKPTIDVGRESTANIEEMEACVNTGANVTSESGLGDISDVIEQRGQEVEMAIEAAQEVAKNIGGVTWQEVYALMIPPPKGSGGRGGMAAAAGIAGAAAGRNGSNGQGATDDGVEIGDDGSSQRFEVKKKDASCFVIETDDSIIEFYNPDQLRDQGGRFADEGKGADEPGYKHPDEAGLTGIDKRLVDYVAHRPLTRQSPDVRSVGKYIPGMHYVAYSKTPFFDELNKLQGTPDPMKVSIEEFAAARRKLFEIQPRRELKVKDLIATQPVVNKDKVKRNIKEKKEKDIFAVRYGDKYFVMDGHHSLAAMVKRGAKKVSARVLHISPEQQEFYREDQSRDDHGRFADEGKGADEPGYVHPGEEGAQKPIGPSRQLPAPSHKAKEFYSPNTGEMSFTEAQHAMRGSRQMVAYEVSAHVDRQLAGVKSAELMKGVDYHDAIGDWSDGAENSVVAEFDNVEDFDDLRYNAAIKGKLLHQKAVLAFQEDSNGKDAIYNIHIPFGESEPGGGVEAIKARLDNAGLTYKTIIPGKKESRVMLFQQHDDENKANMEAALQRFQQPYSEQGNEVKITKIKGTGEFVGEADSRTEAGANYDKIIADYEQTHPDRRHYDFAKEGIRSDGSKVEPSKSAESKKSETSSSRLLTQVTGKALGDGGSSDVYYATFADGSKGVWKPASGEHPVIFGQALRHNVSAPYYTHEVAAYGVAKELGLTDIVPETVKREVDGEEGSMQDFVMDSTIGANCYRADKYDGDKDLARAAAFDYLVGNTDRHAKNWMISNDSNHHMMLIDNGLSFPNDKPTDWTGNRDLVEQASYRDMAIPDEAREWTKKMPEIEKIMREQGLGQAEIDGVATRARDLSFSTQFRELGSGMNEGDPEDEDIQEDWQPSRESSSPMESGHHAPLTLTPSKKPMPTTVRVADTPRLGKAAGKLVHPMERWTSGYTPGGEHTESGYVVRLPNGEDQRVHQKDVTAVTSAGRQAKLPMAGLKPLWAKGTSSGRATATGERQKVVDEVKGIIKARKEMPIGAKLQPIHNSLVHQDEIMDSKGVIHKKKDVLMDTNVNWSDLNARAKTGVRRRMRDERKRKGYEG